jgi:FixJ family two-component response regulator
MLKEHSAWQEEEKIVVSSSAKLIVAVVDDDYRVLESLGDLLESVGYGVRLFASAKQFLESAIAEVDCVISDIGMPGADGFALQQIIRNSRPTLPVILITGRHEFATVEHEAARGGRPLFEKPFDRRELLAAIGSELKASSGRL